MIKKILLILFTTLIILIVSLKMPSRGLAACSTCRAYSAVYLNNKTTYTAIHAYITNATPSIRDGGFSSEVLWIGPPSGKKDYIEMGWRKNGPLNVNETYWGYYDTNGNWTYIPIAANSTGHDYQIEYKSWDGKWHVYLDGVDKGSRALSYTQSYLIAGGEVSDFSSTQHNAMGISNFTNLSYKDNNVGYFSWNGWTSSRVDYSYVLTTLSSSGFQNRGYNP
ncbi:MAG: hypothetical protein H0T53_01715 [Herpetosiphonaceae bacterium]|nr:hypothetical protein [Herpetosiphonaceae bacterium]